MTTTVLRPTELRDDGTPTYEPTVTVSSGDAWADDNDGTWAILDPTPVGGGHVPRASAHLPALSAASVNTVTMTWRYFAGSNVAGPGFLAARMQVFRYDLPGALPDPYDISNTTTLFSYDLTSSSPFLSPGDVTIAITSGAISPADLSSGQLHMRWQLLDDSMTHFVIEAKLNVDYAGGIPPLRQWPRDDGLRRTPPRASVGRSPSSRQGSLRRGPRGNYA